MKKILFLLMLVFLFSCVNKQNLDYVGSGTLTISNPVLTASGVSGSGFTVSWTPGTGNAGAQYLVYYSTTDNIATVTDAETNGTPAGGYASGITSKDITGLNPSATYYYTVVAKDTSGTQSIYTKNSQTTGTSGSTATPKMTDAVITPSTVTYNGLTVSWNPAVDSTGSSSGITYQVYYSAADNISTVADAQTNGTAAGTYQTDTSETITNLNANTEYYYTVVAKDSANAKSIYIKNKTTTAGETTPPVIPSSPITASGVHNQGFTVSWVPATDNGTAASDIQYQVYYSTTDNITSLTEAESNGTGVYVNYTPDICYAPVSLPAAAPSTEYFYTVVAKDSSGNKSIYSKNKTTTTNTTDKTPTIQNPSLTPSGVSSTGFTVSWAAASDDGTTAANLEYAVYTSTSDNIATIADMEANGTSTGYTPNITTKAITGLTADTTYYYTVAVKDEQNNKSIYSKNSTKTNPAGTDTTAPAVGTPSLTVSNASATGFTVSWTAASDDTTVVSALQYQVCYATSDFTNDTATAETKTCTGYETAITSKALTGLTAGNTYSFTVIVKDAGGNKGIYTKNSQAVLLDDTEAPTVSDDTLSISNLSESGFTVTWNAASDNVTTQGLITYDFCYHTAPFTNDYNTAISQTTCPKMGIYGLTTHTLSGLSMGQSYTISVFAHDQKGNIKAYTQKTQTTLVPFSKRISNQVPQKIVLDTDGSMYVMGVLNSSTYTIEDPFTSPKIYADIFVIKYNSLGVRQWTKMIGGDWLEPEANDIVIGTDGIYVTGTVRRNSTANVFNGQTFNASYALYLAKLNKSTGGNDWMTLLDGTDTNVIVRGYSMALDTSGNIFVGGVISDSQYASRQFEGQTLSSGQGHILVAKFNSSGVKQSVFVKAADGVAKGVSVLGIGIDSSNNIYITGFTYGGLYGVPLTNTQSSTDQFIVKLDSSFAKQWAVLYSNAEGSLGYADMTVDGSGNVIIAGFTQSTLDGLTPTANQYNTYLMKYDSSGTRLFTKLIPGVNDSGVVQTDFNQARGLALDTSGNIYITGGAIGSGDTTIWIDGVSAPGSNSGLFVSKFNSTGTRQWTKVLCYGQPGYWDMNMQGYGVAVDGSGNILIVGHNTDKGFDSFANMGRSGFLIQYDSSGNKQ